MIYFVVPHVNRLKRINLKFIATELTTSSKTKQSATFQCSQCDSAFDCANKLKRYVEKIHEYVCSTCKMIYRQIDFFQKHKCTGSPTVGIDEFHEIYLENLKTLMNWMKEM